KEPAGEASRMVTSLRSRIASRTPSQLSGRRLVNAIAPRSKGPGVRAPKDNVSVSVDPAVGELVIGSVLAKYASILQSTPAWKRSHVSGLFGRQRTRAKRGFLAKRSMPILIPPASMIQL